MAIETIKAVINGTTHTLSLNSSTGEYEATINAPEKSSFNQVGGFFDISVTAYDDAGNSSTVNSSDSTFGESLKLYVTEKVIPAITPISPTNSSVFAKNIPTFSWQCTDDDSGIDKDTIKLYIDDEEVDGTILVTLGGSVYTCSYTPTSALSDGVHKIEYECKDNDGNTANYKIEITIDTVPPTLNILQPSENLKTNKDTVVVSGVTNDLTTSPVEVTVSGETVEVDSNGNFSTTVALVLGENKIVITSTDGAGQSTTINRIVYYDNIPPKIEAIYLLPNPVDAGKTFTISVKAND